MSDPETSGVGIENEVSLTDSARLSLVRVQEVLQSIFEFYASATALQEPRLTNAKFTRIVMDAALVDEKLTPAKVDVTFSRVCGNSPHMMLPQFRDAMVRLAAIKYPQLSRTEAVLQIFKNLATFQGQTKDVFSELDDAVLSLLGIARPSLQILYEGYFPGVQFGKSSRPGAQKPRESVKQTSLAQSEAQNGLVQFLTDFEVVPELLPKSSAFAVFREVAKAATIPLEVKRKLGDDQVSGRFFSYSHFACSFPVMAQKAFASPGIVSLVRLMQWMDASKGRVLFSQSFPGSAPKGCAVSLRILPEMEKLPEELRGEELEPKVQEPQEGKVRRNSYVEVHRRSQSTGRTSVTRAARSQSRADGAHRARPAVLPEWAHAEIQKTFGHYASLADPLNRTTLTSQKFGRFLRDCGLLSMEAEGAVTFEFAPEGRRSLRPRGSLDSAIGAKPGLSRSNSTGALKRASMPARRGSGVGLEASVERRASFAVSGQAARSALPLKVFPVPPLSQVEVDLIFVQATRPDDTQERRRSVIKVGGGSKRLMTVESFVKALVDVAVQVMAPEPEDVSNSLEDFCKRVIRPLNEILLRSRSEDLLGVLELQEKPEVKRLLQDCSFGIQKLFLCYASEPTSKRAFWNSDSVTRFAIDFDFLGEVSNLPLQRMFQDACQSTNQLKAEEKLLLENFPLFLLMLANKTHAGQACPVLQDRVVLLFQRINAIACTSTQAPRFGLAKEALLPLSRESTRRTSIQSSMMEEPRRHDEAGLSWDELLSSTF
ncbi:unnamed protein product [Durusdinium trenchii]|uniref:Uncharacterized protein n=1 Tax=Durusdinium trenchii TaxID=1381693 RepID=A0ABP0PB97_9DINO